MGVNKFTFNGTASDTFNVRVTKYPDYEIAQREVAKVSVPGRNGDLILDTGAYANVPRRYDIYFNAKGSGFHTSAHSIASWLCSIGGYARLEDTYDTTVYMMARVANQDQLSNWMNYMGRTTVEFDCKPQRWLKTGEAEVAVTSGATVTNDYMPCYPIFTVTGNGDLNVNGNVVTISNNSGDTITIDCETQNAYKGTTNRNSDIVITGDFPFLVSGNNVITFTTTSVKMIPNWWTL